MFSLENYQGTKSIILMDFYNEEYLNNIPI